MIDRDESKDYTVIDLEMTGLAPKKDKVIEIGAVKVRDGRIVDTYGTLVNPGRRIPESVTELTGITDEMVVEGMEEDEAMERLVAFIDGDPIVGHNISFDYGFVKQWAVNRKLPLELYAIDTLHLARNLLPPEQSKKLENLCSFFHIKRENAHRALDDALETCQVFECLKKMAGERKELLVPRLLVCKVKRQTPATAHQMERLRQLREKYQIADEICWETLTRSEASRLTDRYYAHYGR